MLVVETITKIRRAYFAQKKAIRAICREFRLSRKVVRKVIRSRATEFRYEPARIRIGVPPGGFGQRYTEMTAWLDANHGADGWAMTPSCVRGVLNDAVSLYFLDATLASAFVARWCAGSRIESDGGVFRIRDDEPAPRIGAPPHRTP